MIDFLPIFRALQATPQLHRWLETLPSTLDAIVAQPNGNLPNWLSILASLPDISPDQTQLDTPCISIGSDNGCTVEQQAHLTELLQQLRPWRKGPFDVFGIHIDTEWRSDWKWRRLENHITPLQGRVILDVGCGSGYHCLRMAGAGAQLCVGIDPWWLYIIQFYALKKYLPYENVFTLPLGIQDIPDNLQCFDSVFSMGVLYHRKSPIEHLQQLYGCLRSGGELVLETLIIEGRPGQVLVPEDRYAKMKNVWFIPSATELEHWLKRVGFTNIRTVDIDQTSIQEQRATDWMTSESLADFLDPNDKNKTIEGYPAPLRAVIIASRS